MTITVMASDDEEAGSLVALDNFIVHMVNSSSNNSKTAKTPLDFTFFIKGKLDNFTKMIGQPETDIKAKVGKWTRFHK